MGTVDIRVVLLPLDYLLHLLCVGWQTNLERLDLVALLAGGEEVHSGRDLECHNWDGFFVRHVRAHIWMLNY